MKQTDKVLRNTKVGNKGRLLKLSHHRHSGRFLLHLHTSYPVLAMVVLCVGVLMTGMTQMSKADSLYGSGSDSYKVTVGVPGPAPTVAATITSPVADTRFDASPITVTGSCPQGTYVAVFRNGLFSGVSLCDADGKWTVTSALFAGRNDLTAQVFNTTDVPGPASAVTTVYYDVPNVPVDSPGDAPTASSPASPTTPRVGPVTPAQPKANLSRIKPPINFANNAAALTLKSNFLYKGYYAGETVTWRFTVEGGSAPYAVAIDWGDGTRSLVSRAEAGQFNAAHTYQKQGGYKGSYIITAKATDSANAETILQLLAIINVKPGTATSAGSTGTGSALLPPNITSYVWSAYGVLVVMLASFWLGERREYRHLKPTLKRHHHA